MKFIDLSVPINNQTPVYPGDPKTKVAPAAILDKDGYEDHYLSIGTHAGTHVDAPRHMIKGGKSLSAYLIDKFIGHGVLINTGREITLEKVQQAIISEGDIVLFNTGMSKVYYESAYYDDYPVLTDEIAGYVVDKKIKMIGVDMCSPDHEPFRVHKIFFQKDILIAENLTNLDELTGKDFTVYALPINLQVDAAPARVIAQIQD